MGANLWQGSNKGTKPLLDAAQFDRFYQHTHLSVYRYSMALNGGDEKDAEDITAEAYLRAWRTRHQFSGDDNDAIGWIITIARHIQIDRARYDRVRADEVDLEEAVESEDPQVEDLLLSQEQIGLVLEALQRLPEEQREMIVLRYVLDWPVNQIALHLAISENNVSVSLRRALQRVREWMTHQV
jgi:RNA polymerase sigma-70 factor (ECF subfamily)